MTEMPKPTTAAATTTATRDFCEYCMTEECGDDPNPREGSPRPWTDHRGRTFQPFTCWECHAALDAEEERAEEEAQERRAERESWARMSEAQRRFDAREGQYMEEAKGIA